MSKKKKNSKIGENDISEYYFTFEIIKQYPHVRSFLIKRPLKRSFKDAFFELIGSKKKKEMV